MITMYPTPGNTQATWQTSVYSCRATRNRWLLLRCIFSLFSVCIYRIKVSFLHFGNQIYMLVASSLFSLAYNLYLALCFCKNRFCNGIYDAQTIIPSFSFVSHIEALPNVPPLQSSLKPQPYVCGHAYQSCSLYHFFNHVVCIIFFQSMTLLLGLSH